MEVVSRGENVRRGIAGAVNHERLSAQTECKRGHVYTAETVYLYRGARQCRPCNNIRMKAYSERQKRA